MMGLLTAESKALNSVGEKAVKKATARVGEKAEQMVDKKVA